MTTGRHTAQVAHTGSPGFLGPGLQSLVIFSAAFAAAWPLGIPGDWMGLWTLGSFALSMGVLGATARFWWRRGETTAALSLDGAVLRFPEEAPIDMSRPHELSVRVAGGVGELAFGAPVLASVVIDGFDKVAAGAAFEPWFVEEWPEIRADYRVHARLPGTDPLVAALLAAAGAHRDQNGRWQRVAALPWDAPLPPSGGVPRVVDDKPAEAELLWIDPAIGVDATRLALKPGDDWVIVPLGPGVSASLDSFTVRSGGGASEQPTYLELIVAVDGAEYARVRSQESRHTGPGGGANRVELEAVVAFVRSRAHGAS